jgi:hypothetical protein
MLLVCLVLLASSLVAGPAQARVASAARRHAPQLPRPVRCRHCWHPALRTSWQWQLQGKIDTSLGVHMYDVDGFDVSRAVVRRIHRSGAAAVCYIDAGTWENWRPDARRFPKKVLGSKNGWPGERWLDVRQLKVLRPIMAKRIAMCRHKHFDGVEFDNVDGYANRSGFPLAGKDQLAYDAWLANAAHRHHLSAALKNDLGQIRALLPYFDDALNEQCHQYDECHRLDRFVAAGKAVFGVEYKLDPARFCPASNAHNFNFLKKGLQLFASPRVPCRGP